MSEWASHAAMVLDEPQARCLRETEGHVLTLQMRWISDGERRGRCAFGRLGGTWHEVKVVVRLAQLGLLTGKDATCELIVLSDAGTAWLRAHPPPEDWATK